MSLETCCDCGLCILEAKLRSELARMDESAGGPLLAALPNLSLHSSSSSLLLHLRTASHSGSDSLIRELLALRDLSSEYAESILVLAFLPLLHGAARSVARQQRHLTEEDIGQQVLTLFLQFLRSDELKSRNSHFGFAIAREVRRSVFEWARRESAKTIFPALSEDSAAATGIHDNVERHALLRHFLDRCLKNGLLTTSELDLLIQFKLDGNSGDEVAALNGSSSNAVRQRFKRLVAKLRTLAS